MDWWWGDPDLTAAYAKAAVTDICERWGGDPNAVILTGYSRGAIACNYIGLRDDEVAKLWLAIVPTSHYDNRRWGMSETEFQLGSKRLRRLGDTPQYVCGEHHLADKHNDNKLLKLVRDKKFSTIEAAKQELDLLPMIEQEDIRKFIMKNRPTANVTFADFPWVNHTGEWVLRDTAERRKLRVWVKFQVHAGKLEQQSQANLSCRTPPDSCDLALSAPVQDWWEAIPIGNGQLGALIWGKDNRLTVKLDRVDVWDERVGDPSWKSDEFNWRTIKKHKEAGNFGRIHQTLRVTPAMEAGVTDHLWDMHDVLEWNMQNSI
jgi:hypothetical protein